MSIPITGTIMFDPRNVTNKHNAQSSWKRTAMLMFNCDVDNYYAWFIRKRYNLVLNRALRGAHVTFINDKYEGSEELWNRIKDNHQGREITIGLNPDARSDGKHWWLMIDEDTRKGLHDIRVELGLTERPYFGLHMSIGYANERNIAHSEYILDCINKGFIRT